ncbi:MAG TPA: acetylornithine deacetylase [Stellaceae bacterium]|jgi:acetylornithine deacetylase|nr:acetylornithine deacetylase [Stellaceae bacterium]
MPGQQMTSVEMIRRLVGFDTTSRESNLALIDFVRDYLDRWRVKSELVFDSTRRKANLYATIGPADVGGVMLSGHSDVVPVDGQDWSSDPFKIEQRDGMLYGRGSADMKSFIAIALAKVPEFVGQALDVPIHLALTYDEEVGCIGVRSLVASLAGRAVKPRLCIIGEPTSMKPVIAHKGSRRLRCHVHGHEAHSSLTHRGVNAIEKAAAVVTHINRIAQKKRSSGPFDPAFDPPYTTLQTGLISGGTAVNIVPNECRFDFEMRHLPNDDPDAIVDDVKRYAASLLPEMQAVSDLAGIAFEDTNTVAALSAKPDEEVVQLALALSGANGTGKVSFATEGGFFQQGGIPTVICGPGSIEQAHKADEFIALDQVKQCEDFIDRLIERVRH